MYQIWAIFQSGYNLVKFRNIKKRFWISKYDVSIHPSVILKLLVSSHSSVGISKNTFWYLNMMSAYIHQWYSSRLCHLRGDEWLPDLSNFFVGTSFQLFWLFGTMIYTFPTEFLCIKNENISFWGWDLQNNFMEKI